jgi:hypothetical protein
MASALRAGTDPARVRDAHQVKLVERAQAEVEAKAAETAAATLLVEMADASARADTAARAVEKLIVRVLGFAADRQGEECRELQAEMNRRKISLLGYDRLATPHNVFTSQAARLALGEVTAQDAYRADVVPWRRAADALRADPQAEIAIDLPPLKVAALPVPVLSFGQVERAVPLEPPPPVNDGDGDPHHLPETTDDVSPPAAWRSPARCPR